MISDLAIIAFGPKQHKCLSIPENLPTDLCCGDAEDDARVGVLSSTFLVAAI
jgi:hypothetical protein